MSELAERLTITFTPEITADVRAAAHLAQRSAVEHVGIIVDQALVLAAQGATGNLPGDTTRVEFAGLTGSAFRELRRLLHSPDSKGLRHLVDGLPTERELEP